MVGNWRIEIPMTLFGKVPDTLVEVSGTWQLALKAHADGRLSETLADAFGKRFDHGCRPVG
jgi:hypothetical protein